MSEKRYKNINFENNDLREKDYLDNLVYAVNLEEKLIEYYESDNNKPLYIALTGSWGSGKTTVAKTAMKKLSNDYKKDFRVFEFDAWKYEGDGFRRTFTHSILKQSGIDSNNPKYKEIYNRLYNDKNVEVESFSERIKLSRHIDKDYNKPKYFVLIILFSLIVIALSIKFPVQVALTICMGLAVFNYFEGAKMFKANVSYAFDKMFSPEQFYETVNEILEKSEGKYKLIMIDNIDRCNNDDFVDTISSIKGFFNDTGKIVYLIPFDITQFDNAFEKEYRSYSEKVFDDTIDIKEKSTENVIEFVDKLLTDFPEYRAIFTDEAIGVIANSNVRTPRQIINICNNFITEYNLFVLKNKFDGDVNVSKEDLSYLMKYSIIKINHKELFSRIHMDSDLIKKLESFANRKIKYESVIKEFEFIEWLDVDSYEYLQKTYAIKPSTYDSFYSSQNVSSFAIDKNLEKSILMRDFPRFDKLAKEDDDLIEKLMSYLKKSLIYNKNKNQWKTVIAPKMELIIHLLKNGSITIEQVEDNLNLLLKDRSFFPELIYKQVIDFSDSLYFIQEYISKYPRRLNFKGQLISGLVNKNFAAEPMSEETIAAKVFSSINIEEFDETQQEYFDKYIEGIINKQIFKESPYSDIFNSINSEHITSKSFENIMNYTSYNDKEILCSVIYSVKNKLMNFEDENLFNSIIQFINKISSNTRNIDVFHIIFDSLLELKDFENWNRKITSININIVEEYQDVNLYRKTFEILLLQDNSYLRNILLNLNDINNKKQIIKMIDETEELSSQLISFSQEFIKRFTNDEFETFSKHLVSLYESSQEFENWINHYLFSEKHDKILFFYSKLNKPEDKEILIEYVISQNLNFNQKIDLINFYETEITRYNNLIEPYNNLNELKEIFSNTEKKEYYKLAFNKILLIVSSKANLVQAEVDLIKEITDSEKLTPTEKTKLLCAVGTNKTTPENLFAIYEKIDKIVGKTDEVEIVKSVLIENNYIKSKKVTIKKEKDIVEEK